MNKINNNYKLGNFDLFDSIIISLSVLAIFSFFFGFIFKENSAGAGGLNGDFKNTWLNINTFLKFDLKTALDFVANGDGNFYVSSRTPALYIINAKINPFTYSIDAFLRSIFLFSFFGFLALYCSLIVKYPDTQKKLILILASCLLLSPYYRTSGYWGNEENYATISLVLSLFFFHQFSKTINSDKIKYLNLFLTILFSSLCVYFDQKFVIIPLIILLEIYLSENSNNLKIFSTIVYSILAFPFLYLILQWKSIVPPLDSQSRGVGGEILIHHPMYASTIISFYLLPILAFEDKLKSRIKNFFNERSNYCALAFCLIYLILLFYFEKIDLTAQPLHYGLGVASKFARTFLANNLLQNIFIFFCSLFSFFIIILYVEKKFSKFIFFSYLVIMSLFTIPIYQEYFDPLILIFCFLFLSKEIKINRFNTTFLFFYLSSFLVVANFYYN